MSLSTPNHQPPLLAATVVPAAAPAKDSEKATPPPAPQFSLDEPGAQKTETELKTFQLDELTPAANTAQLTASKRILSPQYAKSTSPGPKISRTSDEVAEGTSRTKGHSAPPSAAVDEGNSDPPVCVSPAVAVRAVLQARTLAHGAFGMDVDEGIFGSSSSGSEEEDESKKRGPSSAAALTTGGAEAAAATSKATDVSTAPSAPGGGEGAASSTKPIDATTGGGGGAAAAEGTAPIDVSADDPPKTHTTNGAQYDEENPQSESNRNLLAYYVSTTGTKPLPAAWERNFNSDTVITITFAPLKDSDTNEDRGYKNTLIWPKGKRPDPDEIAGALVMATGYHAISALPDQKDMVVKNNKTYFYVYDNLNAPKYTNRYDWLRLPNGVVCPPESRMEIGVDRFVLGYLVRNDCYQLAQHEINSAVVDFKAQILAALNGSEASTEARQALAAAGASSDSEEEFEVIVQAHMFEVDVSVLDNVPVVFGCINRDYLDLVTSDQIMVAGRSINKTVACKVAATKEDAAAVSNTPHYDALRAKQAANKVAKEFRSLTIYSKTKVKTSVEDIPTTAQCKHAEGMKMRSVGNGFFVEIPIDRQILVKLYDHFKEPHTTADCDSKAYRSASQHAAKKAGKLLNFIKKERKAELNASLTLPISEHKLNELKGRAHTEMLARAALKQAAAAAATATSAASAANIEQAAQIASANAAHTMAGKQAIAAQTKAMEERTQVLNQAKIDEEAKKTFLAKGKKK